MHDLALLDVTPSPATRCINNELVARLNFEVLAAANSIPSDHFTSLDNVVHIRLSIFATLYFIWPGHPPLTNNRTAHISTKLINLTDAVTTIPLAIVTRVILSTELKQDYRI